MTPRSLPSLNGAYESPLHYYLYNMCVFRSPDIAKALAEIDAFFITARAKTDYMKIDWIRLDAAYANVWNYMTNDHITERVYRKVDKLTLHLGSVADKAD